MSMHTVLSMGYGPLSWLCVPCTRSFIHQCSTKPALLVTHIFWNFCMGAVWGEGRLAAVLEELELRGRGEERVVMGTAAAEARRRQRSAKRFMS